MLSGGLHTQRVGVSLACADERNQGDDGTAGLRDTGSRMSEEATTPDLVELTRAWLQAGTSGDLERMLSFLGPDPVWDMSPMGMGVFEGLAAIRGFYEDWMGAYEGYRIEPEEIHDLGNGVTWGVVLQQGRPMGSGGTVRLRYGTCTTWTDGKAVRVWNYRDIDEACAAAERLAGERG
jgi:ketosteroid isomerase-like protein